MGSRTQLLVDKIRQGEPEAWEQLVDQYEGRLLAFVRRRLGDQDLALDVVQETFLGFLRSLPNFDPKRDLQTYLFTIASNKITDALRRQGRHPLQLMPSNPGDPLDSELDPRKAASSIARSRERRSLEATAIANCLGRMIEEWRRQGAYLKIKVLELLFVKGMPNKDVAQLLGITDQQVANIRFAAVQTLTRHIQDLGLSPAVFPELNA